MYCRGNNDFGQLGNADSGTSALSPVYVLGISSGVIVIAAGKYHTCAIISGNLVCWGLKYGWPAG